MALGSGQKIVHSTRHTASYHMCNNIQTEANQQLRHRRMRTLGVTSPSLAEAAGVLSKVV